MFRKILIVTFREPNALNLEKEGYGCVLASLGLMSGEVPYTVFNAKKSYIKNNKDIIEKFTKAINESLDFVHNSSDKDIALAIKDEFPDTNFDDLVKAVKRYKDADSWWNSSYISENAYNNLLDLMEYNDALDKRVDFDLIVDNSFNE